MHHHGQATGTRLWIAAAITSLFVLGEFVVGWRANSLALISDAGHNLSDVAALILSAWAFAMATKAPDRRRSYGYHRVGVLAALTNALTLDLLALFIFYEGYQRLVRPQPVASLPVIAVAGIALLLNTAIALALRHASQDVNVRAAFIHMAGDAVSSVGVILAGVAIRLTGSTIWDPIVSLLIGAFIVWSSWSILRETIDILLESTPPGIDLVALARDCEAVPGVAGIHDLHVWSLNSNVLALSAHLALADCSADADEIRGVLSEMRQVLRERYHIDHTTLETHCGDQLDAIEEGTACALRPEQLTQPRRHDHAHSQ